MDNVQLELRGVRVNRCIFENRMGPNAKMNLKVDTRTQINIPKDFTKGSAGNIVNKIVVGSPLEPLYLYVEQVTTFADMDPNPGSDFPKDQETMMSLFRTICLPMANQELEHTMRQLCAAYHIPEIKLQRSANANVPPDSHNYIN